MKHLLLVIVCAVIAYAIWATSSKIERRHVARMLTRHGLASQREFPHCLCVQSLPCATEEKWGVVYPMCRSAFYCVPAQFSASSGHQFGEITR